MKYITYKRFKKLGITGAVNIPALTECESIEGFIVYRENVICNIDSENGHQYFAINEDGQGLYRGKLIMSIQSRLMKKDNQPKWDKIWEDKLCQKYKQDIENYWLWNNDFYKAPIEDLEYIKNLIQ